jgi:hypothetical protein
MAGLSIHMLGPLQIMSGGVMVTGLESNKVRYSYIC